MSSEKIPDQNQNTEFSSLIQQADVLRNLTEKMGFKEATAIQAASIPPILEGRDLYAGAKTGSGKTVAFLAPLAQMFYEGKIRRALVLSPVRELALQIDEEAMKVFGDDQKKYVSMPLYGGVPLEQQLRAMKIHQPCLYIATPGRMIDFISEGAIALSEVDVCVLDEADRMCDMGFSDQVTEILTTLPNCKQFLMFSATLPEDANEIMNRFLKDPVRVQVDRPQESSSTIRHEAVFCRRQEKLSKLEALLAEQTQSCIIFCRTRKSVDRVYEKLRQTFRQTGILHAGYSMNEREKTIRAFKESKIRFLVATDVAARGIDVENIGLVVHYELPESTEDYIHRSGRSGRAGRRGVSVAFVEKESFPQRRFIEELQKNIQIEILGSGPSHQSNRSDSKPEKSGSRQHDSRKNSHTKTQTQSPHGGRSHEKSKSAAKEKSIFSRASRLLLSIFKTSEKNSSAAQRSKTTENDSDQKGSSGRSQNRRPRSNSSNNRNRRNSSGPRSSSDRQQDSGSSNRRNNRSGGRNNRYGGKNNSRSSGSRNNRGSGSRQSGGPKPGES